MAGGEFGEADQFALLHTGFLRGEGHVVAFHGAVQGGDGGLVEIIPGDQADHVVNESAVAAAVTGEIGGKGLQIDLMAFLVVAGPSLSL